MNITPEALSNKGNRSLKNPIVEKMPFSRVAVLFPNFPLDRNVINLGDPLAVKLAVLRNQEITCAGGAISEDEPVALQRLREGVYKLESGIIDEDTLPWHRIAPVDESLKEEIVIEPQASVRNNGRFSRFLPKIGELVKEVTRYRPNIRITIPEVATGAGAIAVIGVSLFAILGYGQNRVNAQEPNFPNPSPKKPLVGKQEVTDYYIRDMRSYTGPDGNTYLVGLASLTNDPENNQYPFFSKFKPEGGLELDALNRLPFYGLSVAGSPTNPNSLTVVGDEARGNFKGKIFSTQNRGQSSQTIDRSANGTMFDVQPSADGRYQYISQATQNPSDKSTILAEFDLLNNSVKDHRITGTNGSFSGLSQVLTSDGKSTNYAILPLYNGFFRITYPDFTISPQLGPDQYLLGKLKTFIDSGNKDVVVGFTNFTGDPVAGTGYKFSFDHTTGQQIEGISFPQYKPIYPSHPAGASFLIGMVTPDTISNTLLMGGVIETYSNGVPSFRRTPFIESASLISPTNTLERRLLPTSGDWPSEGTVGVVDTATVWGKRYWLASVGTTNQTGISGLRFCEVSSCIWQRAPLVIPVIQSYGLWLPYVSRN